MGLVRRQELHRDAKWDATMEFNTLLKLPLISSSILLLIVVVWCVRRRKRNVLPSLMRLF